MDMPSWVPFELRAEVENTLAGGRVSPHVMQGMYSGGQPLWPGPEYFVRGFGLMDFQLLDERYKLAPWLAEWARWRHDQGWWSSAIVHACAAVIAFDANVPPKAGSFDRAPLHGDWVAGRHTCLRRLSQSLRNDGRTREAIELCKALQNDPLNHDDRLPDQLLLLQLLIDVAQFAEATSQIGLIASTLETAGIPTEEHPTEFYMLCAEVCLSTRRYREAVDVFEKACGAMRRDLGIGSARTEPALLRISELRSRLDEEIWKADTIAGPDKVELSNTLWEIDDCSGASLLFFASERQRARNLAREGNHSEALIVLESLLKQDATCGPTSVELRLAILEDIATAGYRAEDGNRALAALEEILKLTSQTSDIYAKERGLARFNCVLISIQTGHLSSARGYALDLVRSILAQRAVLDDTIARARLSEHTGLAEIGTIAVSLSIANCVSPDAVLWTQEVCLARETLELVAAAGESRLRSDTTGEVARLQRRLEVLTSVREQLPLIQRFDDRWDRYIKAVSKRLLELIPGRTRLVEPLPPTTIRASLQPDDLMLVYSWGRLAASLVVVDPRMAPGLESEIHPLELGASVLVDDRVDIEEMPESPEEALAWAKALPVTDRFSEGERQLLGLIMPPSKFRFAFEHREEQWAEKRGLYALTSITNLDEAAAKLRRLNEKASTARDCFVGSKRRSTLAEAASEIVEVAFPERVRARIREAKRIIIVPAGPLHDLPLEALVEAAGESMLDGKEVVLAPSASIYALVASRGTPNGPFLPGIVGDPDFGSGPGGDGGGGDRGASVGDGELEVLRGSGSTRLKRLPRAQSEAEDIARLLGAHRNEEIEPLVGKDATLSRVTARAAGTRCVHFAAHSLLGERTDPLGSAVVLAVDEAGVSGLLRIDRIIGEWTDKLSTCALVVLSCCDTGRGIKIGDSLMALPLAFLNAGARAVVATLWRVNDTTTWLLMRRFYQNLLGQHETVGFGRDGSGRRSLGREYRLGEPMTIAAALNEAKQWLRTMSWSELYAAIEAKKYPRQEFREGTPANEQVATPEQMLLIRLHQKSPDRPFKDEKYWAAFVVIGDGFGTIVDRPPGGD